MFWCASKDVSKNKTKTLVSAREVMAERVKKKKKAMTQKQSLKKNGRD